MPWPRAQIWGDTGLGLKPGLLSHWGVGDPQRWRPQISNHLAVGWPSTLHTWLQLSWRQACWHASMDSSWSLSPVYFLPSICPDGGHLWALLTAQAAACLTNSHRLKTQPQNPCPSPGHPFQINCYSCFWSGLICHLLQVGFSDCPDGCHFTDSLAVTPLFFLFWRSSPVHSLWLKALFSSRL